MQAAYLQQSFISVYLCVRCWTMATQAKTRGGLLSSRRNGLGSPKAITWPCALIGIRAKFEGFGERGPKAIDEKGFIGESR